MKLHQLRLEVADRLPDGFALEVASLQFVGVGIKQLAETDDVWVRSFISHRINPLNL